MTDQQVPAGWYPDPSRRFERRWWNGTEWTAHVGQSGAQSLDPEWAQPTGPATPGQHPTEPAATPATPAAASPQPSLGQLVTGRRPLASPLAAVAAGGGFIALVGLLVVVGWILSAGDEVGNAELAILGVISVCAAYGLVVAAPSVSRAAALGGAVLGPLLVAGAIASEIESDRFAFLTFGVLSGAAWLAMFLGPWLRGAPVLLACSLLSGWAVMVGLLVDLWDTSSPSFASAGSSDVFANPDPFVLITQAGVVTLVCALAGLVAAAVADRRGMHVLATPFLAVAVIQSLVGLSAATAELADAMAASILSLLVGLLFLVVGGLGERRGSLWFGVVVATSSLLNVVINLTDEAVPGGLLLLAAGAAVVLASPAVDRALTAKGEPAQAHADF